MNTLTGTIADGSFSVAEGRVAIGQYAPRDVAIFGFRPEDARIVDLAAADLKATVYACELTGNETIVTCRIGKAQVVVKMDKNFDVPVDSAVGIGIDRAKLSLFDPVSGDKIHAGQ
jgi:multiple sugar transport system ATP-binding protein